MIWSQVYKNVIKPRRLGIDRPLRSSKGNILSWIHTGKLQLSCRKVNALFRLRSEILHECGGYVLAQYGSIDSLYRSKHRKGLRWVVIPDTCTKLSPGMCPHLSDGDL